MKLADPSLLKDRCLVDGKRVGEGTRPIANPATGAVLAKNSALRPAMDREEAIRRLNDAQIAWARFSEVRDLIHHPALRRVAVRLRNGAEVRVPVPRAARGYQGRCRSSPRWGRTLAVSGGAADAVVGRAQAHEFRQAGGRVIRQIVD